MELQIEYNEVLTWSKENGILLIKAEIQKSYAPLISFYNDEPNFIDTFKNVALTLGTKIIINETIFLSDEIYEEHLVQVKEFGEREMIEDYQKLERYKNKLIKYSFDFIEDGVIYSLENKIEELNRFHEIILELREIIAETNYEAEYNILPEESANSFAEQLANNDSYTKAKNRVQRLFLARQLFPQLEEYDDDPYRIVTTLAENIYDFKIKPLQENQLRDKIQVLKKEGKTKVNICSDLKISKDTLNKYY